jgi:SM-20-related protein
MYICIRSEKIKFDCFYIQELKKESDSGMDYQVVQLLLDDLTEKGYGIIDGFLNTEEVNKLNRYLDQIIQDGHLQKAGIGQAGDFRIKKQVRGDFISWFNETEQVEEERLFLSKIKTLIEIFNRELFAGIRDTETHFAIYPPGTFYRRHLDRFQSDFHRILTYICYLNGEWAGKDGGELGLYILENGYESLKKISPQGGRLVIFRSHLVEHEVFQTNRERRSITGWMLNQLKDLKSLID